ncbi:PQ-loop repeat [Dillenia turbinata]|uniref:Cystinosin homolog n=1 Tax=Dillenia turbinata TaxID=194707 RepID=A0AAN8VIU6_9MAGN
MGGWNSIPLEIASQVFGWIAFCSWSFGFYPQVFLNFRRKSVVGLNFDFVLLNLTKHSTYLIYNATLFFSSAVQQQYRQKYGLHEMIPVAANDVAFSIHAVVITAFTLFQILIYERGTQKFSRISVGIVSLVWFSAAVCVFLALPSHSWLWLISVFNIGYVLCDLLGGLSSYGQMSMQSIDQKSWVNFYGNIGKTLLSLVSISFDLLFLCQHYLLYPAKRAAVTSKAAAPGSEENDPLIKSSQH